MTGRPPHYRHLPRRDRWYALPVLAMALLLLATPLALVSADPPPGPGTETISGIVYDERGVPAEGVLVRLDGSSLGVPTDEDGEFQLAGFDLDGAHTLVLDAVGYRTARIEYSLADGGRLEVSVYLVEEEIAPGKIMGKVLSFTGDPIEGALLVLALEDGQTRSAVTDDHGRYAFAEVPPSATFHALTCEAPGHATQRTDVTVGSGITSTVDITLPSEMPMELINGRALDMRGLPLPGVTVSIDGSLAEWTTDLDGRFSALLEGRLGTRNVSLALRGYGEATWSVDIPVSRVASEEFRMRSSGEGGMETLWVHVINAWTDDPIEGATVSISGGDQVWATDTLGTAMVTGDYMEGEVTVYVTKPSHTNAIRTFMLEQGGTGVVVLEVTRTSNAVSLNGVVYDGASGQVVADAQVVVNSGGIVWLTRTDREGRFMVHNLPPGVPTLMTVVADGYALRKVETVLREYVENRLTIALEVEVPVTATVVGTVLDDIGAVEGAKVTLWTEDGFMAVASTDGAGGFSIDGVPVSTRLAHCRVEYLQSAMALLAVALPENGGLVTVEVRLETSSIPYTRIQGLVTDPSGFPVDDALVYLNTGALILSTPTVEGHYSFIEHLDGKVNVELSVTADGYGRNSRSAIVSEQEDNWVNLTLPLGPGYGNVLGTVRIEGQRSLEGAEVQLSMGGAYMERTFSGIDGSFAFHLVPVMDQPFHLSVLAEGYDGVTIDAWPEAGQTVWYKMVLREDVTSIETIRGTVTSNEGLPVANAIVRVGSSWNVLTDPNGTFALVDEELEGTWSISASLSGFENSNRIIDVPSGSTVGVDLTLSVMDAEATTVSGMVLKASNGKPLEGATVHLARSTSSTWTFETATDVDGAFQYRGVPLAWDGVTVTVSYPGYHDDGADILLSDTQVNQLDFYMQKVVQPEPAGPVITETEAKQVGAGVTIALGALVLILMTEVGRVALLGLILVPLYTKIKREKVMDHFVRGRIYEFVCHNPGVNYSAIKVQFKLTNGTVTYHLSMLERQEFIRAKQDGIYKRYFANDGGPAASDVEPMSLQLTIAKTIREHPGMTQKQIAKHLGSSKQLVSYHIRRMKRDGQLETSRDGRSVRVFPNHLTPE